MITVTEFAGTAPATREEWGEIAIGNFSSNKAAKAGFIKIWQKTLTLKEFFEFLAGKRWGNIISPKYSDVFGRFWTHEKFPIDNWVNWTVIWAGRRKVMSDNDIYNFLIGRDIDDVIVDEKIIVVTMKDGDVMEISYESKSH